MVMGVGAPKGMQTEFNFVLPRGYVDEQGTVHRTGSMRLATAADEILPLRDPRVTSNQAYLVIILLSRVITRLGTLGSEHITPGLVERLFSADLAYLQDFYRRINEVGHSRVPAVCPSCSTRFEVDVEFGNQGESSATP
ncbi:MAG: phage tail assembly protein [Chloroflexi bacterium]|nr:phage tail assembly protein [Chloroflexota bacterium]